MIVFYNSGAIQNYDIIDDRFKIPCDEILLKRYQNSINFNDIFFDRTGILPKIFNTSHPHPLPLTKNYVPKSFEQICEERAKQLIDTNKVLNVWWSGGIDSTCIIASIISQLKNKEQLVINLTHSSIMESGTIFEKYIRNNFKYKIFSIDEHKTVNDDELSITGYVGNHIMGQGSTNQEYSFDEWEMPWQSFIDKHPRMKAETIEFIQPIINIYPKLETFFDYTRFYLMTFRWHQDIYLHCIRNFHHESFYDTIDFEQWALYSKELPYGNGLLKLPMKNIIQDVFFDNHYYYIKKTKASQLHLPEKLMWCFVLENGLVIDNRRNKVK